MLRIRGTIGDLPVDLTLELDDGDWARLGAQLQATPMASAAAAPAAPVKQNDDLWQSAQDLLRNAWAFTAACAPAEIEFDARLRNREVVFHVRDNGAGFDMARAAKLFQPFQRLHMPHEFTGLGIGLATARRIVLRHGGELTAEAAPDQGAEFCFTLQPRG